MSDAGGAADAVGRGGARRPVSRAGRTGDPPGDGSAWPELTVALDWLPLPSLLLASDGTALAVSQAWSALSGLAVQDSRGDGWISAVEPLDRGVLRARLRDAAAAGRAGSTDVRLAGQPDERRWSRWWWRPGPSGRLIVSAADLGDLPDRDDQWQHGRPATRLVRRGEFVNLTGRALRRAGHQGEYVAVVAIRVDGLADPASGTDHAGDLLSAVATRVSAAGPAAAAAQLAPGEFVTLLDGLRAPHEAGIIASQIRDAVCKPLEVNGTPVQVTAVTGVAVADQSAHSPEELIGRASSAMRSGSQPREPDPPGPLPGADPAGHAWAALAAVLVPRLFGVGLALRSASAVADGHVAARLQQALDRLDNIIRDVQAAALESQAPLDHHGGEGE